MINKEIETILNEQINKEFYSAYLYLAISAYFEELGYSGFANWAKVQAREEVDHGMRIFDHIIDRDGEVNLLQIKSPDVELSNPFQVFNLIYEHEKKVTSSIDAIKADSDNTCDFATRQFIDWYVAEQVEEEKQVRDIIDQLKLYGEDKGAMYHIDMDLGNRQYESPIK